LVYRSAAASAIENAEIIECTVKNYYEITFPYLSMNDVMKILKEEEIEQSEHIFELECKINISFRASSRDKIMERFDRVKGLKYLQLKTE
jgi:putative IMPACT (imprinted ancient) family translation regulator